MYDFHKSKRLLKPNQYKYVFDKALTSKDKFFTILYRKSSANQNKLGLAISKKTVRLAHQRNRIKRIIREYYRMNIKQIDCKEIIVLAKNKTASANNRALVKSLQNHWLKLSK